MKFGFIPTEGGPYLKEALEEAVAGEALGFDSVWLEEHHSIHNHYWPSPLMALAGIATRTASILLGTDIAVLPFYHPVRVAEDVALLDIMSGGRAIFGAAIGYRAPEFELYDVALDGRGGRFVEMLKIMRALWTQERVEFAGKHFKVNGSIEPRPERPVPIWLGGWGELSLKRAATLADAWVPGPTANLEKLLAAQTQYRAELAAAGKDPAQAPTPLTREVIVAETRERAWELAEKFLMVNYRDEYGGGWQHPLIGSQDRTPVDQLEALSRDRFIIGAPEDCITAIRRFQDTFGLDHLICRLYFPGMPHAHIMQELKLLAAEVIPRFSMNPPNRFPPLDFERSRFTGWTRDHWVALLARLTAGYARAAARSGSPARALYPDDRRGLPDAADAIKSFARMASAWGAWLANPANPAELVFDGQPYNVEALLRQALLDGTDPANPLTYWGGMAHMDQRLVESGDFAVMLWLSRARVFDRLSAAEQAQVLAWLAQVDGQGTYYDNWVLFSAVSQTVRLKLGQAVPLAELDANLDTADAFYRGDGWYVDGAGDEFELYNAWMFNWHFLHWAAIDGDRRPELRARVLSRAASFLSTFTHFFGANGAYAAWGRSLVYRFAAVAGFATGYQLGIATNPPGLLRRLSSGCLRYFYDRGLLDPDEHFVRQGFHGNFPPAGEAYISPGSVYWCCHGLYALSFAADDPLWTAPEEPLPVERADFDLALAAPGLALSGRRATGQVLLLNSRSGQEHDAPGHNYTAKYGKLVYSSHFPFNVLPAGNPRQPHNFAPDAMLALTADGRHFGHRLHTRRGGVAPRLMWCCFDEYLDDELQAVWAAVLLAGDRQIRLAVIRPSFPVQAYEAPGALGAEQAAGIQRRSDPAAGWEYAEAEGRAVAIRRLLGFDGQQSSRPFLGHSNINLAYPYSEQPVILETQANVARRVLASVSLVRPAPFDPAAEFAGLAVRALPGEAFEVTLPQGETAFVAVTDALPTQVKLSGTIFTGPAIRHARVGADGDRLAGVGLLEAAGVVQCQSPASVSLARAAGAVNGVTDAGLSLAEAWLGGSARAIALRCPDGSWQDVTQRCGANHLPNKLVQDWAEQHQRRLVEFRMER